MSIWEQFQKGTADLWMATVLAAGAAVLGLLLAIALLRPLVRVLSRKDPEKVAQARIRRLTFAFVVTALALGAYVFFRATLPPEVRHTKLGLELSELVLIIFGGYAAVELVLTFFADFLPQARGGTPVAPIFKDLLRALILLGVAILAVKQAFPAADIGAIVTTSAILSVVVGLALQESLSNIFAGLMLTIDRPYKAGEWIEVDGKEGKVVDSNWRSTRILTRDNDVIYVPNSTMAKSNVINFSAPTHAHMCRRRVGVEYGAQPNKVRHVLVNLMTHAEGVLKEPLPDAFVVDYGDSAVVYELRFWIEDYARRPRIEAEVLRGVWYHLKREGISIPFPIRDVYLRRQPPERKPEEVLSLLQRVDILQPLKEEELVMLAEDLSHLLFARGEVVCRQGEQGSSFYLIKSGAIGVKVRSEDGVVVEVAQLRPGSYFGEMSLLTGDPRSSTCTALEDSELLCLDRDSFSVLLQENPPVAQAMSEILATRVSIAKEKLAQERETIVRSRGKDDGGGSRRILEKIWTIFGFKK